MLNALLFSPNFMQGEKGEHLELQSICALQKQSHGQESALYVCVYINCIAVIKKKMPSKHFNNQNNNKTKIQQLST